MMNIAKPRKAITRLANTRLVNTLIGRLPRRQRCGYCDEPMPRTERVDTYPYGTVCTTCVAEGWIEPQDVVDCPGHTDTTDPDALCDAIRDGAGRD